MTPGSSTRILTPSRFYFWLCLAWMTLTLVTYIVALPTRYAMVQEQNPGQATLVTAQIVSEYLLIAVVTVTSFWLVLRRPGERIVLLMGASLISGIPNFTSLSTLAGYTHPLFTLPGAMVLFFSTALGFMCLIALPDGYFYPRRLVWLAIPIVLWDIARYLLLFVNVTPEVMRVRPGVAMVNVGMVTIALVAMLYRYRYHATPRQRQQFKWLFLGVYSGCVITGIGMFIRAAPMMAGHPELLPTAQMIAAFLISGGGILICFALVIAVSRYGLWDVDLTINRSLVTGLVTLMLLVLFFGIYLLMQAILRGVLPGNSGELAAASAALIVGLAFNPIRRRVRKFIDRRVYGLRFDLNQLQQASARPDIQNPGVFTGRVIGGYELLDVIGRGGIGEVYKGAAPDGQVVAVKILREVMKLDPITRRRFEREGTVTVKHPHIVDIYGYGETDGILYVILQYVEGITLSDLLEQRGHLALPDVLDFLPNLTDALTAAHAQGYIHRDIKPSNIMLRQRPDGETYEAVLMDFGIARILNDTTSITGSGAVGTIDYMAPEQITSSSTVDHRADLYALGVVLYQTLTGKHLFTGNPAQVLFAHLNQPAPDVRLTMPDLPDRIAQAVEKLLAKDPADRFQSAQAFIEAVTPRYPL